jgi:hypothetical protein
MVDEIYIAVLDEGVDVWRPVPARKIDDSTYTILRPADYDPEDERWEFPPGSTVVCQRKRTAQGNILAAVELKQPGRRTA